MKHIKFADDFIANNPSEFTSHEDESKIRDWLEKAYLAGSKGCTYAQLGGILAEEQFKPLLEKVINEPSKVKLCKCRGFFQPPDCPVHGSGQ